MKISNDDFGGIERITEKIVYINIQDIKARIKELIYANDLKLNIPDYPLLKKNKNLISNGYLSICINTKNICN
ncbi:hypothetical protein KA977_02370 [Candidatus Dependentiae bacterium]|nr:hypothetical protein [Candidatus Dependentiae bacterium]